MKVEIHIPSPGESISEVEIARWLINNGAWVEKDQEIAEIESEKATLPLLASVSGVINILAQQGSIKVGEVACTIDTDSQKPKEDTKTTIIPDKPKKESQKSSSVDSIHQAKNEPTQEKSAVKITPLAQKLMNDKGLNVEDIISGLKKITTNEVHAAVSALAGENLQEIKRERFEDRASMSQLRKKLSQRLVTVKNETAMLTTFNEVDMSRIMEIRKNYQKDFQDKYGLKLGLMSFFTKAVVEALKLHPLVNSRIDGDEIITPNYYDIGIAVQTPKGLMVPVLRDAETLSFAQIEQGINLLAEKGRSGRIGLDDLEGGTFTITNGGVFGSMLSTPLLNPPQSGILGMHNIVDRPVAVNGKVEIRPVMYIALSYDHRLIDGKDSVGFLVKVKQMLENPQSMLLGAANPDKLLLGL